MVDFGYDISDFTDIDPIFGTMADFTDLTAAAKSKGYNSFQITWQYNQINKRLIKLL